MRLILTLMLTFIWTFTLLCQNEDIYDDDPHQVLPIGMDWAEYHFYSDTGLAVIDTSRIEPPFWWTGFNNKELQILIYDQNIGDYRVKIRKAQGIELLRVKRVPNPNYLFVYLYIKDHVKPGKFDIILEKGRSSRKYQYELKEREVFPRKRGIDNSDFIYHIMPDRFANGDYSNDSFEDMLQRGVNRNKMYFRHGGDLTGILNNLNYIRELGATALWLTPVLENDQPYASYHGYAVTDLYNIDRRFGTNELYRDFVRICNEKGIKVVKDVILNHMGHMNWIMRDIPDSGWIHQWPEFTRSNYRASIMQDPYHSQYDLKKLKEGWFDFSMPDLDQKNPELATYLIQNNIWWIEYAGIDDFRIDTWFFPDQDFLYTWVNRIRAEYPDMLLFGEAWVHNISEQAYYTMKEKSSESFKPNLPSVLDFQVKFAIEDAVLKKPDWTSGILRLYYTLTQDWLYENPYKNVLFLDSHDKARIFTLVAGNLKKHMNAIGLLLTLRGTPVMYYGTELHFDGDANPDGNVRQDFPGGWKEDEISKFSESGRTETENQVFNFVKTLANFRKNTAALQTGKTMQFVPEDGIYVFFRYDESNTVMVILNPEDKEKTLDTSRFSEIISGFSGANNVITGDKLEDISEIHLEKDGILILDLR